MIYNDNFEIAMLYTEFPMQELGLLNRWFVERVGGININKLLQMMSTMSAKYTQT